MSSIAHLIETGGPGGAENVFLTLASRTRVQNLHQLALVGREGWLADRARQCGLAVEVIPAQGSVSIRYFRELRAICKRHDVRLLIAHLFGASVYASAVGMALRVPVISVFHGQSDVSDEERFLPLKRALIHSGSKRIVFVSEILRSALSPRLRLDERHVSIIENGIDLDHFRQPQASSLRTALAIPAASPIVGAIGNVRAPKGYDVLLKAAAEVCSKNTAVQFVIAGDTSGSVYPQVAALSDRLKLSERVHFLGLRGDVKNILSALDVYVLSSTTEGFSLSLIEAMASGRAIVATRSGGPQTLIADELTGILVPPNDEGALARGLLRLLDDAELRTRLGKAASASVSARFSVERMVEGYGSLIKSILKLE